MSRPVWRPAFASRRISPSRRPSPPAPVPRLGDPGRRRRARRRPGWTLVVEGYAPAARGRRDLASDRPPAPPHDGQLRLLGELDGRRVAASSIFINGDARLAELGDRCSPPPAGCGIQRAMIAARARVAADARLHRHRGLGARVGTVVAQPRAGRHATRRRARSSARAADLGMSIASDCLGCRVSGPTSASLRVERSGPGDVVARVTLSRPDVHNAFDAALIGDLRTAFATLARESPDPASSGDPGRRRAVVLRRRRPRLDARRDVARTRRATSRTRWRWPTCSRPSTPAPCRSSPASTARRWAAGWGCCAVSDVVIAESGHPLRLHRDAAGDPAVGHQPVRRRQDRREPRPGAVPGRTAVRRHPRGPDRAGPRDRRRRGGARPSRRGGGRGPAGVRTDRDASGQGDRPRDPRPGPRIVQVAHGAGHRPTAHERGGPGGLPGLHREAASRLGTRSGRCLTEAGGAGRARPEGGRRMMLLERFRSPSGRAIRNAGPRDRDVAAGAILSVAVIAVAWLTGILRSVPWPAWMVIPFVILSAVAVVDADGWRIRRAMAYVRHRAAQALDARPGPSDPVADAEVARRSLECPTPAVLSERASCSWWETSRQPPRPSTRTCPGTPPRSPG